MVAAVETRSATKAAGQPWVWMDDREAAREATRFLLGLGHADGALRRHPGLDRATASGPQAGGWRWRRRASRFPSPSRRAGIRSRATEAGQALAADPGVTAVLCGNDDLALGVIRAMHEAGRPIPQSVSVVGFDDTPASAFFTPALTTVRLDFVELGRACVAQLRPFLDPRAGARARAVAAAAAHHAGKHRPVARVPRRPPRGRPAPRRVTLAPGQGRKHLTGEHDQQRSTS